LHQIQFRRLSAANWAFLGFIACIPLLAGYLLANGKSFLILALFFIAAVVFLYLKNIEAFILMSLAINHEMFNLLPDDLLGGARYQGLLYVVLLITGGIYFLLENREPPRYFIYNIFALLVLTVISVTHAAFMGQPLIMGIKASKSYFLILFFFVFVSRHIDVARLFRYIVLAGIILTLINNIQYFTGIQIFFHNREMFRIGQIRFLSGGLFLIFSLILAFAEFLHSKKKWCLAATVHIGFTIVFQGQTRMTIFGIFLTFLLLMYLMDYLDFKRIVFVGIPIFVVFIWLVPIIQSTFFGDLYQLTRYELRQRGGNFGVRLDTYDYYLKEIKKSPIIGRGIWNDQWKQNNPEDMKYMGLHLGDIGMTSLAFHMGIAGVVWLILLLSRVFKLCFEKGLKINSMIHPGIVGYFIFGIVTFLTLNSFTRYRAVIYLALALALISQMRKDAPSVEPSD